MPQLAQVERYQALLGEKDDLQATWENRHSSLTVAHERALADLAEEYESRLSDENAATERAAAERDKVAAAASETARQLEEVRSPSVFGPLPGARPAHAQCGAGSKAAHAGSKADQATGSRTQGCRCVLKVEGRPVGSRTTVLRRSRSHAAACCVRLLAAAAAAC